MTGKDVDAERDRMRLMSHQRIDEIKSAALATFCHRRRWIATDKPLLADVLREYPKFQSDPLLVTQVHILISPISSLYDI